MPPKIILPGATLGVLGGGQLGRMFALSAAQMGYRVICYTPEPDSPAGKVCAETFCAPYEDTVRLEQFAARVQAVTVEFENIPADTLEFLQRHTAVRPAANVLHVTQNRLREKQFLRDQKFPTAAFFQVNSIESLQKALEQLGTPAVVKTAGFGYDGKGQRIIKDRAEAAQAYAAFSGTEAVVEQYITFEKEISVIGARSPSNEFAAYGPIENTHSNHILDLSSAPARISRRLAQEALDITRSIMEKLEVVGLLCVEFFAVDDKRLLVNELAPRPHNSGHLTIEACPTSQFEQQLRAVTGLPLGATKIEKAAAMANLLGDLYTAGEPDWASVAALPAVHLHLYGKTEARPGRKMGHLTALAEQADEAIERVVNARALLVSSKNEQA